MPKAAPASFVSTRGEFLLHGIGLAGMERKLAGGYGAAVWVPQARDAIA
jgi:hypothetical protein